MPALLEGKVIVVTGSGNGVGKGIALEAARQGAKVIVNDLGVAIDGSGASEGPAQTVVNEIKALGGDAAANTDSVAEYASAEKMMQQAMDLWGRVDGVVNNAGNMRDIIFHKMTESDFDSVIKVHLKGSWNMSRAAAPYLKAQNGGAFVHMTSSAGLIGNFGQVNYIAAKMGIVGMSKAIALDMEKFNVRSNCIAPFAFTRLVDSIPRDTPEGEERYRVNSRMEVNKIAPFTCALMTDNAKDVTGQIFGVRANEIYLFSQPRPIRSVHAGDEGWTVETCIERAIPAMKGSFFPLDKSRDVFTWDPV